MPVIRYCSLSCQFTSLADFAMVASSIFDVLQHSYKLAVEDKF